MLHSDVVCRELKGVAEKWYELGVELQVDRKALAFIQSKSYNNPMSYLQEVVLEWLKLESSQSYLPTWDHLIKAIAHMGMVEVAKQLQHSHPVMDYSSNGMLGGRRVCGSVCCWEELLMSFNVHLLTWLDDFFKKKSISFKYHVSLLFNPTQNLPTLLYRILFYCLMMATMLI